MKIADSKSFAFPLFCVALCSVVGLFSGFNWFFDLFNHFRPQAVVAAVLLLAVLLPFKSRYLAALAIAVIILNTALMGARIYAFEKNAPSDNTQYATSALSVLFANVHTPNTNYAAAVDLVRTEAPDIFVTTEVDGAWTRNLARIEKDYPHRFKLPSDDNFGMAVYSKIPFEGKFIEIGHDYHLPLFYGDFGTFALMMLHPIPPTNRLDASETALYISAAARMARTTKLPLIVVGDLNATFWSDNIKPLISAGLSPANPSGITWTWPAGFLPLAMQIDHIFVRNAQVRAFAVLNDIGSDHFPVSARISLPE